MNKKPGAVKAIARKIALKEKLNEVKMKRKKPKLRRAP
jgi:hypothetical protein